MNYTINIQIYSLKKYRCDILKYQTVIPTDDEDYLDFCISLAKIQIKKFQKNNSSSFFEMEIINNPEKQFIYFFINTQFVNGNNPLALINVIQECFTQEKI